MMTKTGLLYLLSVKYGTEDPVIQRLRDVIFEEDNKIASFKEAVCDTVNEYHNEKKELINIIEELVLVLSEAAKEYEPGKVSYSKKRRQLLWDTAAETLLKSRRVLKK